MHFSSYKKKSNKAISKILENKDQQVQIIYANIAPFLAYSLLPLDVRTKMLAMASKHKFAQYVALAIILVATSNVSFRN